jgi:DNA-binding NarL/FixJ family response regulator
MQIKSIAIFDETPIAQSALLSFFKINMKGVEAVAMGKAKELIKLLKTKSIDIVITDVSHSENFGIDIISMIKDISPATEVVIFSSNYNNYLDAAAKADGAMLVLSKIESLEYLLKKMKTAYEQKENQKKREFVLKTKYNKLQIFSLKKQNLTSMERNIVYWSLHGLNSTEIAEVIDGSINTVNNQRNNLLKKFNCRNVTHLVVYLMKIGYISLSEFEQ